MLGMSVTYNYGMRILIALVAVCASASPWEVIDLSVNETASLNTLKKETDEAQSRLDQAWNHRKTETIKVCKAHGLKDSECPSPSYNGGYGFIGSRGLVYEIPVYRFDANFSHIVLHRVASWPPPILEKSSRVVR